jgi:hypothetical protein
LVALVGALIWAVARSSEPTYEGKPLSRWLEGHVPTTDANPRYGSPGWHKADEALRGIGTHGIPTLLRMIRAKDSPLKLKLVKLASKQRFIPIRHRYAFRLNEEAEYAFQLLGTNAAGAVPSLIKVYQANVSDSSRRCAAEALGHIGPAAAAAVPILLTNFTHADPQVRFEAVSAMLHIRAEPELVVPALIGRLNDPKVEVRWNAVVALSLFGRSALAAVPPMLGMLVDPAKVGGDLLKAQVETALWRIAPEKISNPVAVESPTPMVADGVTTEALDVEFNGERHTLIRPGRPVPCSMQLWSSGPRTPLSLYRRGVGPNAPDQFLGHFQVMRVPAPPEPVNVSVLCVIADQQVFLCARDNNRNSFLEIRPVENAGPN